MGNIEKLPNSAAGTQMRWFLEQVQSQGEGLDEAEVASKLTREVKSRVPTKMLVLGFRQIHRALGDFDVEGLDEKETSTNLKATVVLGNKVGDKFRFMMEVEYEEPNPIKLLGLLPAPDLRAEPAAKSWEEFEEKFKALASRAAFLAAEVVDGELIPIHAFNDDDVLAVGSASKLYVLGELARQIEEGSLKWLKEIPVREELKGMESLLTQRQEGATFSLQHFAEQMMEGDGTAFDHILDQVERSGVEKVQELMGHSSPDRNVPFLSTRELLVLKSTYPKKSLDSYLMADSLKRREILETKVAKGKLPKIEQLLDEEDRPAIHIDQIEWFASPSDLARALIWLRDTKGRPRMQALGTVMTKNPGLPFDKYAWAFTSSSIGGETGVLSMSWLLGRHVDDRWFVMTGTLNHDRMFESVAASPLFMAASDLLAFRRKKAKGLFGRKKK